jgi:hypothetical protein
MWQHDTLNYAGACCLVGVFGQEISDAGQPDPLNPLEAKYPSGVAGFIFFCIYICIWQVFERKAAADLCIPLMIHLNAIAFKPQS